MGGGRRSTKSRRRLVINMRIEYPVLEAGWNRKKVEAIPANPYEQGNHIKRGRRSIPSIKKPSPHLQGWVSYT